MDSGCNDKELLVAHPCKEITNAKIAPRVIMPTRVTAMNS